MYFLTGPILFFLLKFNYNFNKKKNYKRAKKFSKKKIISSEYLFSYYEYFYSKY